MRFQSILLSAALMAAGISGAHAADKAAIEDAAAEIIKVMKQQGPIGMQNYVLDCYARDPLGMHCFYLDTGAAQITLAMSALMQKPRNPFFMGEPFALRIAPVMKHAGVPMEQEGVYLKELYKLQRPALYAAYTADGSHK